MKIHSIVIGLIFFCAGCSAQVFPDSLIGIYTGNYYYKQNPGLNWTITTATEYVTSIDSSNCKVTLHGVFTYGGGQTDLYTDYSFCYGNPVTLFFPAGKPKFFGGDSIRMIADSVPTPAGDFTYARFFGKKVFSSNWSNIDEKENLNHFIVYPNPAKDFMYIQSWETEETQEISLLDVSGKSVLSSQVINSKTTEIDLRNLSNGFYFLRVWYKDGVVNKKVVVQH